VKNLLQVESAAMVVCAAAIYCHITSCAKTRRWQVLPTILLIWAPTSLLIAWVITYGNKPLPRSVHDNTDLVFTIIAILAAVFLSALLSFNLLPFIGLWRTKDGTPLARRWNPARLLIGMGLIAVTMIATVLVYDRSVRHELEELRDESRKTIARDAPVLPVAESNAATHYQPVLEGLDRNQALPEWLQWVYLPRFDPREADVQDFLIQQQPTIEMALKAAEHEVCCFEGLGGRSISGRSLRVEDEQVMNIARILIADARSNAARGEWESCWRRFAAVRRLSHHLANDRDSDRQKWAIIIELSRASALEAVLADTRRPAGSLSAQFPIRTDDRFYRRSLARALVNEHAALTERLVGLALVDPKAFAAIGRTLEGRKRWTTAAGAPFLRMFIHRDAFLFADVEVKRLVRVLSGDLSGSGFEVPVSADIWPIVRSINPSRHLLLEHYHDTTSAAFDADACASLSDVAIAMEGYRDQHREYPQTIAMLVPEFLDHVPMDPHGPHPVGLVAADGGVVLYTRGQDGYDDQGRETATREQRRAGEFTDATFCLGPAFYARRVAPPESEPPYRAILSQDTDGRRDRASN
jgi:uncharacterized protein YqcC (DUF446 family)